MTALTIGVDEVEHVIDVWVIHPLRDPLRPVIDEHERPVTHRAPVMVHVLRDTHGGRNILTILKYAG